MPNAPFYGTLTKKLYDIWRQASFLHSSPGSTAFTASADATYATASSSPSSASSSANHQTATSRNVTSSPGDHRRVVIQLQQLFHSIDLFPTESQVYEMVQCASRCSSRLRASSQTATSTRGRANSHHTTASSASECVASLPPPPSPPGLSLTFGEFCFFASVLINSYRQNSPPPKPLAASDTFYRRLELVQAISEQQEENDTKFDVFLGGSCNPTRWRTEVVIPELKKHGITYYNPQVDQWGPELIELEDYAKKNSEVLFFVIDNQTRAIAAMVEVAFIASTQQKLILAINDLDWPGCRIGDEELSVDEYESLRKGRRYLRDVVERQGIPIFSQIPTATRSAIRVLSQKIWPQDLTSTDDGVTPVRMGHVSVGDKMIHMFKMFESFKNGNDQFTFVELILAYKALMGKELPVKLVQQLAKCHLERLEPTELEPPEASPKKSKSNLNLVRKLRKSFSSSSEGSASDCSDSSGAKWSSARADSELLPSLERIPINFEQFCMIVSELNEKLRKRDDLDGELDAAAQRKLGKETEQDEISQRSLVSLPDRLMGKFGNLYTMVKSLLIPSFLNGGPRAEPEIVIEKPSRKCSVYELPPTYAQSLYPGQEPGYYSNELNRSPLPDLLHRSSQSLNDDLRRSRTTRRWHSTSSQPVFPQHHSRAQFHHSRSYQLGHNHAQHTRLSTSAPTTHRAQSHLPNRKSWAASGGPSSSPQSPPLSSHLSSSVSSLLYDNYTDLFIGGSLDHAYLQEVIIPLLKKHSITYCLPKFDAQTTERMIPLEAKNIEKSRVLLFLITDTSIDISSMILTAHYFGLGYRVVLCIQYIDPVHSPLTSKLSQDAIKDYNRGRAYLSDMATKMGVPVFDQIPEAIDCCIKICTGYE